MSWHLKYLLPVGVGLLLGLMLLLFAPEPTTHLSAPSTSGGFPTTGSSLTSTSTTSTSSAVEEELEPTVVSTTPETIARASTPRSTVTTAPYVSPRATKSEPITETAQGEAPLACIRSYEGDYDTNTGNGYYGAYQFDLPTWQSVGGTGNPAHASPAEQDMRAQMLYDRRGLDPWPTPSQYC